MSVQFDQDGQPLDCRLNYNRRLNRAMHELIGFLRGIMADGVVSVEETEQLAKWILANRELAEEWPISTLARRIDNIFDDGVIEDEERRDLGELINQILGGQNEDTFIFAPTDLPLTKPAPDVIFDRNEFVLTGKFLFGSRKVCVKEIEIRGGRCADNVKLQTSYLVIGSMTSRDWKFSSFGNKILKAVEYSGRCPIAIVSEKHWESFLLSTSGQRAVSASD